MVVIYYCGHPPITVVDLAVAWCVWLAGCVVCLFKQYETKIHPSPREKRGMLCLAYQCPCVERWRPRTGRTRLALSQVSFLVAWCTHTQAMAYVSISYTLSCITREQSVASGFPCHAGDMHVVVVGFFSPFYCGYPSSSASKQCASAVVRLLVAFLAVAHFRVHCLCFCGSCCS